MALGKLAGPGGRSLSAREGRAFALTLSAGFLFVALLAFWRDRNRVASVAASVAAISVLAGLFIPQRLGPVMRAWISLGEAIGYVTTPILMALVYYAVLTPFAIAKRLFTRRRLPPRSGWYERPPLPPAARMERQF